MNDITVDTYKSESSPRAGESQSLTIPLQTYILKLVEEKLDVKIHWNSELLDVSNSDYGSLKELEHIFSEDWEELNKFVRDRGFDIELKEFHSEPGKYRFGIALVLMLMLKWKKPGVKTYMNVEEHRYKAVSFSEEEFYVIKDSKWDHPILRLDSGDFSVYLTKGCPISEEYSDQVDLLQLLNGISINSPATWGVYSRLIMPELECDIQREVDWLLKLTGNIYEQITTLKGEKWGDLNYNQIFVEQALEQVKLKLDHTGCEVKIAELVQFVVASGCASLDPVEMLPPYYLDEPFYLWIKHKDIELPLFFGYFDVDSFIQTE